MHHADIGEFIARWKSSGASERANCQGFIYDLCDVLEVPRPDPSRADDGNTYVFEKAVKHRYADRGASDGRIDLYKRGCFVLEAKQGSDAVVPAFAPKRRRKGHGVRGTVTWDHAMERAREQARRYARALPVSEGWPPFLIIVDVGHCIELYADFSGQGKAYLQFPDAQGFRIGIDALAAPETRELLRKVWTAPDALDPSRRAARVTEDVAAQMAALARSLEEAGHGPRRVSGFLMRCLFTMFAEDVLLLEKPDAFTRLLEGLRGKAEHAAVSLEALWRDMDRGGFSLLLQETLPRFNGSLFKDCEALPLTEDQLESLIRAGRTDWQDVEPAIFGTLMERALDKDERHKLGAHYTPRAYVERLVMPTVIEPLREEWAAVKLAAGHLALEGDQEAAAGEVEAFHRRLCEVRILDPACGSGNFLYVTMEHMKRLEGEVLDTMSELGRGLSLFQAAEVEGFSVTPEQFLGIEVNQMAAAVARVVLWIGYLQWHFRTRGRVKPPEPVLKTSRNIEHRDAVLAWDGEPDLVTDAAGKPVTRWDGVSTIPHPVTGKPVPDESKQVVVYRYQNPRRAAWPKAEFIVGNPPFIGNWRMRSALGEGYTEALRATWDEVPESVDYVMYWWNMAAHALREGPTRRFGLITTNSLHQKFSRRVLARHMEARDPLSLVFAIPDHPWVDSSEGADVRISMTVARAGESEGSLLTVTRERAVDGGSREVEFEEKTGRIHADLKVGVDLTGVGDLKANDGLSSPGVKLHGAGFIVTPEEARSLGLGRIPGIEEHIRPYRNGRDIMAKPRGVMVIDLHGLTDHEVRERYPEVFQWVYERVKPERDQNRETYRRVNWWLFGRKNTLLRGFLAGLKRYIATVETSKHRVFVFLDEEIRPDNMLVCIGTDRAEHLGVLSSRVHVVWALAAGGRLGIGNDPRYNKTRCFDPFPFPDWSPELRARIADLAEKLDGHRKARQALFPDSLTLTGMYNVVERLRSGEVLIPKEQEINEQGLCEIVKQLHDELDAAVFEAYGWPGDLEDEEVLARLVALNHERAGEEARGRVRWLRPEFQAPEEAAGPEVKAGRALIDPVTAPAAGGKAGSRQAWPDDVPGQVSAVLDALDEAGGAASPEALARCFKGRKANRISELLETLVMLGQAEVHGEGYRRIGG